MLQHNYLNLIKLNRKYAFTLLFIVFLVFIDLLSKFLARTYLSMQEPITIIPKLIDFVLAFNKGISFGWFAHSGFFGWLMLALLTTVVVGYILWLFLRYFRSLSTLNLVAFSFLIGGALGNGWERVKDGLVTDFILYRLGDQVLFVNNLADHFISLSIVLFVIDQILRSKKRPSSSDAAGF